LQVKLSRSIGAWPKRLTRLLAARLLAATVGQEKDRGSSSSLGPERSLKHQHQRKTRIMTNFRNRSMAKKIDKSSSAALAKERSTKIASIQQPRLRRIVKAPAFTAEKDCDSYSIHNRERL
jgi:hypothetical protein